MNIACFSLGGEDIPEIGGLDYIAPPFEIQPRAAAAFVAHEAWKTVVLLFETEKGSW